MEVELIHQVGSVEGNAIKMFLKSQDVNFKNTTVEGESFKQHNSLPVLLIDGDVRLKGFEATKLSNLFLKLK